MSRKGLSPFSARRRPSAHSSKRGSGRSMTELQQAPLSPVRRNSSRSPTSADGVRCRPCSSSRKACGRAPWRNLPGASRKAGIGHSALGNGERREARIHEARKFPLLLKEGLGRESESLPHLTSPYKTKGRKNVRRHSSLLIGNSSWQQTSDYRTPR